MVKNLVAAFSRLEDIDWAWIATKVAAATWATALLLVTPPALAAAWGIVVTCVVMTGVVLGAIVSVAGLVIGALGSPSTSEYHDALRRAQGGHQIEIGGIVLMIAGVAVYLMAQVWLIFVNGDWTIRIAQVAAFVWIATFLAARIVEIRRRQRREAAAAAIAGIRL